ncbi:MAG: biotin--[acetyl-CoA-carboxylase] ligase [Acidimicrobiales bacterium]
MGSIIWRVEHFEEIQSTNSYLVDRLGGDVPEGAVVYADFQSSGRGRLDRTWLAPPRSSLLCSVLLRPVLESDQLQLVVGAVALAARAALVRICGVRPELKWPNDLVVGGEKIAGILAEVVMTPLGFAVVVGFGINLTFRGPEGVASTSVLQQSGLTVAPRALLDLILEELEPRRSQLDSAQGQLLLRREYESALCTIGRQVRVETASERVIGSARGVDEKGRLIVDVDGSTRVFAAGDVVHLRSDEVSSA